MSIFEQAARLKLRFATSAGQLAVEDLWDLPLTSKTGRTNLNDLAVVYHRALQTETVSFVDAAPAADPTVQLRFDLVKHVIDVRVAENAVRAAEAEKAAKKQRILALLAEKEDATLRDMSQDELRALLASL